MKSTEYKGFTIEIYRTGDTYGYTIWDQSEHIGGADDYLDQYAAGEDAMAEVDMLQDEIEGAFYEEEEW